MEFTKEEKKAIERINNLIWGFKRKENKQSKFKKDLWGYFKYRDYEATEILLNLIEKQQKEIEENQVLIDDIKDHRIVYIDTPEFEEKFISKDKIREKLKKLRREEDKIYKLNYELEPEKAIDSLLLRIGDLKEFLKEEE